MPFEPSHFLQNFDRLTVKHALQNTQNDCHSGFLTALNCTKFVFGLDLPRTQLRELTALPQSSWLKGRYFKGRGGAGRGEKGGRMRKGGEGKGKRGKGMRQLSLLTLLNVPTPIQATEWNSCPDSLAEEAANFLWVAVDGVEQPWEAKAQDGSSKECREHDLLLPVHVGRLTREEPHSDHNECHEPCKTIGMTELAWWFGLDTICNQHLCFTCHLPTEHGSAHSSFV